MVIQELWNHPILVLEGSCLFACHSLVALAVNNLKTGWTAVNVPFIETLHRLCPAQPRIVASPCHCKYKVVYLIQMPEGLLVFDSM